MNLVEGDFWVFQVHVFEKFNRQDGVERWINKSLKKWEKKWGEEALPTFNFGALCCNFPLPSVHLEHPSRQGGIR